VRRDGDFVIMEITAQCFSASTWCATSRGLLIAIGQAIRSRSGGKVLRSKDRTQGGPTAPAQGPVSLVGALLARVRVAGGAFRYDLRTA